MVRDFGAGKDAKQLVLQPVTGSPSVQVQVLYNGDPMPTPFGGVRVALYPGTSSAIGGYRDMALSGNKYERNIIFTFQRGQLSDLGNSQVVLFLFAHDKAPHAMGTFDRQVKQPDPIALAPGALDQVTKVLKECEDDLMKSWGYDPQVMNGVKTPPIPVNAPKWFTVKDFPTKAEAKDTATPSVRFTVGADGAVSNCAIVDTSGSKMFDDKACELVMTKAKYTPAVGADGKPVAVLQVMPVIRPGPPPGAF
jgi:TonB family protein